MRDIIARSYSTFRIPDVTPLVKLDEKRNLDLLELFHGVTFAFKDIALQFLGNLFEVGKSDLLWGLMKSDFSLITKARIIWIICLVLRFPHFANHLNLNSTFSSVKTEAKMAKRENISLS